MENGVHSEPAHPAASVSNGVDGEHRVKEHKSSSHKHKHKHKEKDRDRKEHKSSHKSKHKDRHHGSSKSHSSDQSRSHSSSLSSSKDRHSKDKPSSSSSSSNHHRHSSSKNRESGSSNSHHKSRDHNSSSSSSKHKERSTEGGRPDAEREGHGGASSVVSETISRTSLTGAAVNGRQDIRRDSDDFRVISPSEVKREPDSQPVAAASGHSPLRSDTSASDEDDFSNASRRLTVDHRGDSLIQNETADSEEDLPLSARKKPSVKKERNGSGDDGQMSPSVVGVKKEGRRRDSEQESEEDLPLSARRKLSHSTTKMKRRRDRADSDDDDDEQDGDYHKPVKMSKKVKKESNGEKRRSAGAAGDCQPSPTKKAKKEEEGKDVWRWWEEEKSDPSVKWTTLEHKGPLLAPDYEPLPSSVKFYYDGHEMRLSPDTEEVATFYARMLDHDYTTKEVFNKNFWHDWRKFMTDKERERMTSLKKCDFRKIAEYFKLKTEEKKAMSKEEKKAIKQKNEEIVQEYGFCMLDGHREKIGNFRVEPPGLFRGRGEHPKQGLVKRRLVAKDIIINCGRDSKVPEPPPGQRWKKVQHDNTVTWLACWKENIQGMIKYVMLNAASRLKGEKDWSKYEMARRLHKCVDTIRDSYRNDFKSKEMRVRQRSVAMYFIDKLALRAGNEKDEDQADTVGCCSLRVEHIKLHEQLNGKEHVVVFDFLGKDSIRYYNEVAVEKRVFKNLLLFVDNKEPSDDLFDRLNTTILNKYLTEQMDGLTAKVFRTYNASHTLQQQLDLLTEENMTVNEKILAYNRANRAVAILCNHQRAVPKTFEKSMENLMTKISDKKQQLAEAEKQYKSAKKAARNSAKESVESDKRRKAVQRIQEQLSKLELSATDKEENKDIALGTSKLNYLDPRISVAWCKKWEVPIEKVYNKTQREKFRWAIDMAGPEFEF